MNIMNFSLDTILTKVLMLPGIIVALSFHEFAHAYVSDRLGDPTPRRQGRVTINPLAHIDWIGFLALLLVGFGWGNPVQIDPGYYKNRRRDEFLVSIAGVTMNLIPAVIFSIPARAMVKAFSGAMASDLVYNIYLMIFYIISINIVLMIFNLIPCPPLDGWGIITQIFRLDRYSWWYKVYQYGTWILLALILLNVTDMIITPGVSALMRLLGL
jgi:Zn-dependent protease